MANNYTLFSADLTDLTPEQVAWFGKYLVTADKAPEDSPFKDDYADNEYFPSTEWEIDDDSVVFYSEESGNPEDVAVIIHTFFNAFNLHDRYFDLEWAATCSKPRIGEFFGGAIFVTSKKIRYFCTGEFLTKCRREWENSFKRKPAKKGKKK